MNSRYRWVILGVGVVTTAAISALRQGLPSLAPALRDQFGLSLVRTGVALASVTFGIVLTLLAWGALTDRVGERPVLTVGLAGAAAALLGAAYAPGFDGLLIGLVGAGMLGASATNASGRAVMGWFARSERAMALGVRQMAVPLGGAIAALSLPLIAAHFGLRAAFTALAAGCLVAALCSFRWMREPPPPPDDRIRIDAPPPTRDRRLWRLGVGSSLLIVAQSGILAFVVVFLHDRRGLSIALSAAVLAAMQLGGAIARVLVGRWSDRRGERVGVVRWLGLAGAGTLAGAVALMAGPNITLVPVLVLAGILAMSWNGLSFTAAAEMSGRERAGTALGVQNTLLSAAGVVTPIAFGAVAGAASFPVAYSLLALAQLGGWIVLAPLVGEEAQRGEHRAELIEARDARREASQIDAAAPGAPRTPAGRTCNASVARGQHPSRASRPDTDTVTK